MSWRTVYISSQSHLSFKNNYLVVRSEDIKQIHLSEIHTIIIDNNMTSVSIYLLNELRKAKIKVIICDEKHNPSMELVPYYGAYDTSKMIEKEADWQLENCGLLWQAIVKAKIYYQGKTLEKYYKPKAEQVLEYAKDVVSDDKTNREGHAAKVYFNSLFGNSFSRDDDANVINAYLNYGYSIILSMFNREIVNNGYITQIGLHHRGPKNPFNLACDLMEPFRPIVDQFTYENSSKYFLSEDKMNLVNLMNKQFLYDGKTQYLSNIISSYTRKLLASLETGEIDNNWFVYESIKE